MRLLSKDELKRVITRIKNLHKKVPDIWEYDTCDGINYVIERCRRKNKKHIEEDEIPYLCDGILNNVCGQCKGKLVLETSEKTSDIAKLISYYKNITPVLANMLEYLTKFGAFVYWKKICDEKPPIDKQIELYIDKKRYIGFFAHDGNFYDMKYKKIDCNSIDSVWWMEKLVPPEIKE